MEKGFILVVTLSALMLATIVVSEISYISAQSAKKSDILKQRISAEILCDNALEIVKNILVENDKKNIVFYSENLASDEQIWSKTYLMPVNLGIGEVKAIITDERGKFNINSLADTLGKRNAPGRTFAFEVLVKILKKLKIREEFACIIADWIDNDEVDICKLEGARNWFIPFPEELMKIFGEESPKVFLDYFEGRPDALSSPFFTFWPYAEGIEINPININTTSEEVLSGFIDEKAAKEIYETKKKNPFKSIGEVVRELQRMGIQVGYNFFRVNSNLFSTKIECTVSGVKSGIQAVLMKEGAKYEEIFFRRL